MAGLNIVGNFRRCYKATVCRAPLKLLPLNYVDVVDNSTRHRFRVRPHFHLCLVSKSNNEGNL